MRTLVGTMVELFPYFGDETLIDREFVLASDGCVQ